MQAKIETLLELITSFKETNSIDTLEGFEVSRNTLEAIANLVDDNYDTLEPIMASHGITY